MSVSGKERVLAGVGFAAFFVLAGAGTTAITLGGGPSFIRPAVQQPIVFNHRKHVKELDLACSSCHLTVEKEAFSGLPDAEVCAFPKGHVSIATSWSDPTSQCALHTRFGDNYRGPVRYQLDLEKSV